MLLFTPCIVANAVLPATLLDPFQDVMVAAVVFTNFAWWTNFKLLAFALDRGQLMRARNAPPLVWLMVAALPILIVESKTAAAPAPAAAVGRFRRRTCRR